MGTKIFKIGSFETELASTMEKELFTNQLENKYSFDKVSKAADYINAAAELLDDTGFATEAKVLTKVIERLASEEEGIELSDEDLEELFHGRKNVKNMSIEEMIKDPLEQEIIIDVDPSAFKKIKPYDGSTPLYLDSKKSIIETEEPEYITIASLANKLQEKYSKKKV